MADFSCPLPQQYPHIVMAHGGGGRLMRQLLDGIIQPALGNPGLAHPHDSAVLAFPAGRLAFTTDSYVINPVFFPGGDIGKLAVCGTLNDLAMVGARPLYLSCALILEEGFALADLRRVIESMQHNAALAGVQIVTGDTKVVGHGSGDGVFINTTGIGVVAEPVHIAPSRIQTGDDIIISSDIARHGIAVMLAREGLAFEHNIESDCADVSGLVQNLLAAGVDIHCLRDLTRGGLASALLELASASRHELLVDETQLPIQADVATACEILGFDPLYIANEGCFALFVPQSQTTTALAVLNQHPLGAQAEVVGNVLAPHPHGQVTLQTALGIRRGLDWLSGEQLPRIC